MSNTSIVPVSQVGNALTSVVEGFEGYQIKPSQVRLVQQGSAGAGETLKVGKLVDTGTNQHFDKMLVVPLDVRNGRVFFPPTQNVGGTPLCRSTGQLVNNRMVPASNVPEKQSNFCDTCEHGPKKWKNYKITGEKPDCDETINLLFIERESGFPYYLSIKGQSIKNFRAIEGNIFKDILMNRMKGVSLTRHDYTYEIVPTRVQGSKGNYYMLNFLNLSKIATPGEYGPLYEMFVKSQNAVKNEEDVDSIVDAEVDEGPQSYTTDYIDA